MPSPISRLRPLFLTLALPLLLVGPATAGVTIHCLDVGQGDATLIVSTSGKTLLFDAGDNGKGTAVVVPYLNGLGISQLNYIVTSHYHADHIGGMDEVWNAKGPVLDAVYDRGWSYTTATYNTYATLTAAKRVTATDLQVIDLGDGVTATVVALNGNGVLAPPFLSSTNDENDFCLALHVQAGDFDYFQGGDLSGINDSSYNDIETSVGPRVGDLEVYHVDHHGSYSASNANFLAAITPEVAIISVGSNSYGHPAQVTLDRIAAAGAFIYQTETGSGGTLPASELTVVHGHIVITTSGSGTYTVNGASWPMDEQDLTPVPTTTPFALLGNYPNPFNPLTNIRFVTARGGPVSFTVYDLAGRRLVEKAFEAAPGAQAVRWEGQDGAGHGLPSGVYLYRLQTPEGAGGGRMTLTK
ncbi:MAG: ComEC/Rec2 family competence protein [Candidatus Krumholzibacteriia bacterium]